MVRAAAALAVLLAAPLCAPALAEGGVPEWVRNVAGWWAGGEIDDATFASAVGYLASEGIIGIPDAPRGGAGPVPDWVRTAAGQWAGGLVPDSEFLRGLGHVAAVPAGGPACGGEARCMEGRITRVTDGDTVRVGDVAVRLALASAPELDEPGGAEARELAERLCPVGSEALVDEDDGQTAGSHGRMIGEVYCGGASLNAELLDSGIGYVIARFCAGSEFGGSDWAQRHGCPAPYAGPCDPAYPGVCIAPPPPDLDCGDVPHRGFGVLPPDPHRFDSDGDGTGCGQKGS